MQPGRTGRPWPMPCCWRVRAVLGGLWPLFPPGGRLWSAWNCSVVAAPGAKIAARTRAGCEAEPPAPLTRNTSTAALMLTEPLVAMRSSCACVVSCWRILLGQHVIFPAVLPAGSGGSPRSGTPRSGGGVPRRRQGQKIILFERSWGRACGVARGGRSSRAAELSASEALLARGSRAGPPMRYPQQSRGT